MRVQRLLNDDCGANSTVGCAATASRRRVCRTSSARHSLHVDRCFCTLFSDSPCKLPLTSQGICSHALLCSLMVKTPDLRAVAVNAAIYRAHETNESSPC